MAIRRIFRSAAGYSLGSRNSCCGGSGFVARTMSSSTSDSTVRRSSSPSPLPWQMIRPAIEGSDMVYWFYSVSDQKILSFNKSRAGESPDNNAEFVGSSHGWLVSFNEHGNKDLFLSDPISGRHIKLPSIHTLPIPEPNLASGYDCVNKVILSGSPDDADCRAVMSFGPRNRLAFCCPGRGATEWIPFSAPYDDSGVFPRSYTDFAYSTRHKLFFCSTRFLRKEPLKLKPLDAPSPPEPPLTTDFEAWDLADPLSPKIDWALRDVMMKDCHTEPEACRHLRSLVLFSDDLFLVMRHVNPRMGPDGSFIKFIYYDEYRGWDLSYPYKTIDFDVHKIDREEGRLKYMKDLDGLAMFVGDNHSFALPASDFPQLKPNSIYFTDSRQQIYPEHCKTSYGGHDNGIFDYGNRSFSPAYYPCDYSEIKRIVPQPIWFTTRPVFS